MAQGTEGFFVKRVVAGVLSGTGGELIGQPGCERDEAVVVRADRGRVQVSAWVQLARS